MGRRKPKQAGLWLSAEEVAKPAGHPYYSKLSEVLKRRSELVERSFTHMYDTGGMRRTHLRGGRTSSSGCSFTRRRNEILKHQP